MYNAQETIIKALESVRNQTYTGRIETIIVNDGSTDKSLEIVNDYIDHNSKLNIKVINRKNGGVSSARNAGMSIAKGDFIALLDSDDEWNESKLEQQVKVLVEDPEIDLLGCNRNGEVVNRFFLKKFERLTLITSRLLLYKNFFSTPTVIFKRDILKTVGFFDETQRFAEEGNYWIRICKDGKCMLLNESYVITGDGKPHFGYSGLSSNLAAMEKGELKNIKDALRLRIINHLEFIILNIYSLAKYLRRLVIVNLR
jgi:glycosyltransferase involved in cell wall biosynthesis